MDVEEEFKKYYSMSLKDPKEYKKEVYYRLDEIEERLKPLTHIAKFMRELRDLEESYGKAVEIMTKKCKIFIRSDFNSEKIPEIQIGNVSTALHVAAIAYLFGDRLLEHLKSLLELDKILEHPVYAWFNISKGKAVVKVHQGLLPLEFKNLKSLLAVSFESVCIYVELRGRNPEKIQKLLEEDLTRLLRLAISYSE